MTLTFGDLSAQNLPRGDGIRSCIVPSPGHVFISADFVGIELVTLGYALAWQFGLRSALFAAINCQSDLHRMLAAEVLQKRPADVTTEERRRAKAINFGLPGGMGADGLMAYAHTAFGVEFNPVDAQAWIAAWYQQFPEMTHYMAAWPSVSPIGGENRRSVFTATGRLRAGASFTEAHNTIFQGLAADGAKLALWALWRVGYRVVNFIHDEVLVEVPADSNLRQHAERIRYLMVEAMRQIVPDAPINVNFAAMSRWYAEAEAVYSAGGELELWSPASR